MGSPKTQSLRLCNQRTKRYELANCSSCTIAAKYRQWKFAQIPGKPYNGTIVSLMQTTYEQEAVGLGRPKTQSLRLCNQPTKRYELANWNICASREMFPIPVTTLFIYAKTKSKVRPKKKKKKRPGRSLFAIQSTIRCSYISKHAGIYRQFQKVVCWWKCILKRSMQALKARSGTIVCTSSLYFTKCFLMQQSTTAK